MTCFGVAWKGVASELKSGETYRIIFRDSSVARVRILDVGAGQFSGEVTNFKDQMVTRIVMSSEILDIRVEKYSTAKTLTAIALPFVIGYIYMTLYFRIN